MDLHTPAPSAGFRHIVDASAAAAYRDAGWWGDRTLSSMVAQWAGSRPERAAFVSDRGRLDYATYDRTADVVARTLVAAGLEPGQRVAVWIADSATVHVALLGVERAGLTAVGIGARSGLADLQYLVDRADIAGIVTTAEHRGAATAETIAALRVDRPGLRHLVVPWFEAAPDEPLLVDDVVCDGATAALGEAVGPDDLFLINSTSGTTGRPKCVVHTQNRWFYFHAKAVENSALDGDDVFLGAVPAPFGFGLWTSHFTPTILGSPTVVMERFDAGATIDAIERERVTVLSCVSTQFVMMLNHPRFESADLSSLRVMFTGGESIPYQRALEFEERTGCRVLQFFGSNETGLLSGTDLDDDADHRLRTAGRIVPEMQVRLYDGDLDVTASGRGQPACRGPATCVGYLDDPAANAELFTPDGWMRMGDICTLDADGYLSVVGRTSDIIIRGGKNISAAQVEDEVATHDAVVLAAAIAVPDEIFGERVCAVVELHAGRTLTFDELCTHLDQRGTATEIRPEHLLVLDELPRSVGGKVSKGELRSLVGDRFGTGRS